MDRAGGVLPNGLPETTSAGADHYNIPYTNPHHQFLYGNGGALDYSTSSPFANEYAFVSPDASVLNHYPQHNHRQPQHPQDQQLQSLSFSYPAYSAQVPSHQIDRQQLPQNHVQHVPTTISPSQLQPSAYTPHHDLSWEDLSAFSNGSDTQMQGMTHNQPSMLGFNANGMHRTTLISPPPNEQSHWAENSNGDLPQTDPALESMSVIIPHYSNALPGFPWITVDPEEPVPTDLGGMIFHISYRYNLMPKLIVFFYRFDGSGMADED